MTVAVLKRTMTEREFRHWMRFNAQRRLPTRRLELYFAQLAYLVAKTMGGSTAASINEFLIDFEPPPPLPLPKVDEIPAVIGAKVLSAISGKGVRILGQRRREREAREAQERMH